jgi:hypothetical protein
MATGFKSSSGGFLACRLLTVSRSGHTFSSTPYGFNNTGFTAGTMAETGVMSVTRSSVLQERCVTNAAGATVLDAALTDVQVNAHVGPFARVHTRTPHNVFHATTKPTRGGEDRPNSR